MSETVWTEEGFPDSDYGLIPSTHPDASAVTKGYVRLAGDLAGTADNPTVPGLADKLDASDRAELDSVDSNAEILYWVGV
jgi:hypothetical protein